MTQTPGVDMLPMRIGRSPLRINSFWLSVR
jgi:hypothetical protein